MTYRVIDLATGTVLAPERAAPYTVDELAGFVAPKRCVAVQRWTGRFWEAILWQRPGAPK